MSSHPVSPVTPDDPHEPSDVELDEAAMDAEDAYLNWLQGGRDE